MKKTILLFGTLILLFQSFISIAQVTPLPTDTPGVCGNNTGFLRSMKDSSNLASFKARRLLANKVLGAVVPCGRFNLIFDDVTASSGYGFDDHTGGIDIIRQNCVCAVATYIQSVFNIPVGDGSPIEIFFPQSFSGTNPPPSFSTLAVGGPIFSSIGTAPGFYGGNVFLHYNNGVDPDPTPGVMDGTITVNFLQPYRYCGQPRTCGQYDFFSVLLHEFTHSMGWMSMVQDFPMQSIFSPNQYSMYDKFFLYYGDVVSGPLTKIVNNAGPSINPVPANALRSNQLWVNGNLSHDVVNNQNFPGFCNLSVTSSMPPNTSSHIGDYSSEYQEQSYLAPGFTPDYVMGPFFDDNQIKQNYTPQELRSLLTMGYQFTPAFAAANAYVTTNKHPFTTKTIYDFINWGNSGVAYSISAVDNNTYTIPDKTISNCQNTSFDLTLDNTIKDANPGDPKWIFPGSLYNIRGCGIGGNNHNALSVNHTATGDIITFSPRANFIGRAQFGFHLYDGKEKGAYMVYTIDVTGCSPCPQNIVVNGDFEEGEEVKTVANPFPDNAELLFYRVDKYPSMTYAAFPDGVIYNDKNQLYINNAAGCTQSEGKFGNYSFPGGGAPNAPTPNNYRYNNLVEPNSYFALCSSPQHCSRYILEFDIYTTNTINLPIGFTNNPLAQSAFCPLINSVNQPITGQANWQHFAVPITFCSNVNNCNYLVIENPSGTSYIPFFIDNLDLHLDLSPPAVLGVAISPANPPTQCPNTNITLTANVTNAMCAVTYNWTPGNLTTAAIIVNPSATTNYIVTVNDGCSNANANVTVNVVPNPPINVTASPGTNVCSGTSVTLSATAVTGATYQWYLGGSAIAGATGQNYTTNVAGNYYVVVTLSGCQNTSSTITIVINTPTAITVIASPSSLNCSGGPYSSNLSVSPAINNPVWSPAVGLSCTNCSNPTATPSSNQTYNVTGTDINGCTVSGSVNLTVQNCQCTNGITLSGTVTNASFNILGVYSINTPVTISGTVNLTLNTIYFGPGGSLIVPTTASLNLNACHLLACTDMWQGITVQAGGNITVTGNSLIEDAINAIDCSNWNQTGNTLTVNGAIFNKNRTSISVNNYSYPGFAFPGTIKNAVFTCRKIPVTYFWGIPVWPSTANLKTQTTTPSLTSPYYVLNGYAVTTLRNPYFGLPCLNGIYVNTVGYTTQTGSYPPTPVSYDKINIGATTTVNKNLFDLQSNGVYAENGSNTLIINSDFANSTVYKGALVSGNGVYSINQLNYQLGTNLFYPTGNLLQVAYPGYVYLTAPTSNPPIDNCNFYDCIRGVNAFYNGETHVAGTTMQSNQNVTTQNGSKAGALGINVLSEYYFINDLSYNQVSNTATAIDFNTTDYKYCFTPTVCDFFEYLGTTHIDNNVIQNDLGGGSGVTSRFVKYGIIAENVLNCQLAGNFCTQQPTSVTTANNNFIYSAYNGIVLGNWQFTGTSSAQTDNNYVTLVKDLTLSTGSPGDQFGVTHYNNINNAVYNNNINAYSFTPPAFITSHGVWAQMNTIQLVQCNQTSTIQRGFEFVGPSTPTQWMDNKMQNNAMGLFLNGASTVIGPQTSTTFVNDNHWLGTWNSTTRRQTFNFGNANLNNSKLYCRSGSQYFPIFNGSNIANREYNNSINYPGTIVSGTSAFRTCPALPTPCPNFSCRFGSGNQNILERVANNTLVFSDLINSARFISRLQLLRSIKRDSTIMDSSAVLHNFFATSPNTPQDIINTAESHLTQGNISAAQSTLSTLTTTDTVSVTHKTFLNIITKLRTNTYTTSDSSDLYTLATSCPLIYGTAVFQARALYDGYYQTILPFRDYCLNVPHSGSRFANAASSISAASDILLYPNPTDNIFYVTGFDVKQNQLPVEVKDVTGKLVYKATLQTDNGIAKIDCILQPGVYFVTLTNGGIPVVKKIIVQ